MKIIALLGVLMCLLSCDIIEPHDPLMGDWLWQESYSYGCFSSYKTIAKPGERIILRLKAPNQYTISKNDTLKEEGTFRLEGVGNLGTNKKELQLQLINAKQPTTPTSTVLWGQTIRELTNKRLYLANDYGTGGSGSYYVRAQ